MKRTTTASQPPANPAASQPYAGNEWTELENHVNRAAALLSMVTEKLSFLLEVSEPDGEASGSIQFGIMELSRQAIDGLVAAHQAAWKSHCAQKNAASEAELQLP